MQICNTDNPLIHNNLAKV